ncbi:uncharacterized protein LOC133925251 [Phragmites australis]|uniref:uncharacterized protein LOC133925251 n=1 Tax=Phragmites australis TaxID=29695 RepID=UPI002D77DD57|nr:uncharacterized protein LOC133925251 [Phragmites australis]
MSRSCCYAVSVLLALAVTASATAPALLHEEPQDKRIVMSDAHQLEEATRLLAAEGARVALASVWAAKKDDGGGNAPLEGKPSSAVATQGDDQGSSGGSNERSKEEGSSKEGEKQAKSCLTKEECHKKKLLCGKGCTLSAHSKCAAKCSKSCVPTC